MPPTAKELDVVTPTPEASAGRSQPVALEVPVSVNGARTVAGSDKREPFSETSMTVLVFANGAVIRLASSVVPGQLLFLTNEKTKKEVVCQVVKSKNYSNVSGYVELEFTEAVTGFWGMRFPGERSASQLGAPAASATPIAPPAAAPKPPAPAAINAPKPVASRPTPPPPVVIKPTETKPVSAQPRPIAPISSLGTTTTTTSLPRVSEIKPAAPAATTAPPSAPANSQSSTDALKRESARLQEQLSSMLFTPEAPAKAAPPAPVKSAPPVKNAPLKMESTLDVEEVKIPSWLEPLARNAPSSAPEAIAEEEEPLKFGVEDGQEFEVEDLTAASIVPETRTPVHADATLPTPLFDMPAVESRPASAGNNKGIMIGAIAAGLVLAAAGGAWFARRSPSPVAQTPVAAVTTPAAAVTSAPQPQQQPQRGGAQTASVGNVAPASSQAAAPSHASSQPAALSAQPVKTSNASTPETLLAYKQLAEPQPQAKKPALGKVHLAAPTANKSGSSRGAGDAEPALTLNENQVTPNSDAFGGGLVSGNSKQPAAPSAALPVGGDVKPAHMLSSVSPVYPALAKNQHVEGDVRIDALIDVNGHVSAMKVVSGATLLHQAAMDALRQWKYQPAILDGKPVPMHLTVTIQFRLQ
jgi:TonB family protein